MDIAELRRKANEEKAKDGQTDQGKSPSSETVAAGVVQTGQAEESLELQSYELDAPDVYVPDDEDGLDRLFSGRHAQELAVAESGLTVIGEDAGRAELAETQYLAFHIGREEYALEIAAISEIIKVKEFTEVPRAPEFVLGILSLRGVVVPVFDLTARLNLGESVLTANSRIIVCQSGEIMVGLLVDSIHQVIKLADDGIEPPPAVLSGLDRDFMTGVGRHDGRMIILLDVENVLNIEMI